MTRKTDWEDRLRDIKKQFPSVDSLKWTGALDSDNDVFTQVLGDLLKAEGKRSRPGKRPTLSRPLAEAELNKLSSSDYSEHEFPDALRALKRDRSIRAMAHKTGLNKDYILRFLQGTKNPTFREIEQVAAAFGKDPSYFLEYRIALVLMFVDKYMTASPEVATNWFLKLRGREKMRIK